MTASTVHVKGISSQTSDKEVNDFFSFCGKITNITITPVSAEPEASKSATITFEREAAAKTALLLDQTQLGASTVLVSAAHNLDEIAGSDKTASHGDEPNFGADSDPLEKLRQENKPRSTIFAELLSHGYVIGDQALQKGIELDKQHGILAKFQAYLNNALATLDQKFHASDKAKAADEQYHITDKLFQTKNTAQRYFESALGTPAGRKVRQFYEDTEKQVLDIHAEARRLADLRKEETEGKKTKCSCKGEEESCSCPGDKCECADCGKAEKSGEPKASDSLPEKPPVLRIV